MGPGRSFKSCPRQKPRRIGRPVRHTIPPSENRRISTFAAGRGRLATCTWVTKWLPPAFVSRARHATYCTSNVTRTAKLESCSETNWRFLWKRQAHRSKTTHDECILKNEDGLPGNRRPGDSREKTLRGTCPPRLGNARGAHVGTGQQRQKRRRPSSSLAHTLTAQRAEPARGLCSRPIGAITACQCLDRSSWLRRYLRPRRSCPRLAPWRRRDCRGT